MAESNAERYLANSFGFSTLKTISIGLSTLLLLPLILHKIGFDTYGLISLVMFFGGTHGVFDLGFAKAATLIIGKSQETLKANQAFSDIIFGTIILGVFIGLILCILSFLGIDLLARH